MFHLSSGDFDTWTPGKAPFDSRLATKPSYGEDDRMDRNLPFLLCVFTTIAAASKGASIEEEAKRLQEKRDDAAAKAIAPINRDYRAALDALLKKATKAGDYAGAEKIKAYMGALDADSKSRLIEGSLWTNKDFNSRITFSEQGRFREQWGDHEDTGIWQAISTSEIRVALDKGVTHVYTLSADSESIQRGGDGKKWKRSR